MCSVIIKKTGKQVVLGWFTAICTLRIKLRLEIPGYLSHLTFVGTVKQFCANTNLFTVMPSKPGKIKVFLSSLVYILLIAWFSITSNGQIKWSQSTNFNRILRPCHTTTYGPSVCQRMNIFALHTLTYVRGKLFIHCIH